MSPGRVVIADDDVLLREGVATLLERSGFDILGRAGDGEQLVSQVRALKPDLVVVDIRMPPTNTTEGLDAARVIRDEFPETGILVLSAHVDVEHAIELLASGERIGYLLKSRVTDVDEFIETVDRIARGGSVVDPVLVMELVDARREAESPDKSLEKAAHKSSAPIGASIGRSRGSRTPFRPVSRTGCPPPPLARAVPFPPRRSGARQGAAA